MGAFCCPVRRDCFRMGSTRARLLCSKIEKARDDSGTSRRHFASTNASSSATPRTYVEQRRIEQAKRLLTESTQSLAQVAMEVGFGTQSRLTSTFKRRTGFTPGEYRRERA